MEVRKKREKQLQLRDSAVNSVLAATKELLQERRHDTVISSAVVRRLELVETMQRIHVFFCEPVTRLTVMRVCHPVFEKLEVARIATIIAVAHATRHVDAVLQKAMLDGGDRTGMDDALNGA